jgi:hypothetical protein
VPSVEQRARGAAHRGLRRPAGKSGSVRSQKRFNPFNALKLARSACPTAWALEWDEVSSSAETSVSEWASR